MKANNLTAVDYQQVEENGLVLKLTGTTADEILQMDTSVVRIATDAGDEVVTFVGLQLYRITLNVADKSYEVHLIPAVDDITEQALKSLAQENDQLHKQLKTTQSQLDASIQSNSVLEECLIEMAGVVYA